METQLLVGNISAMAPEIARVNEELADATKDRINAEAQLLLGVVGVAMPALKAIAERITIELYETGGRNGLNPVNRYHHYQVKGVCLSDGYTREKDETGNRGEVGGVRLYLLTDGELLRVARSGSFSHWQGEATEWKANVTKVGYLEAMHEFDLGECLESLYQRMQAKASDDEGKAAERERDLAERLRAVLLLVSK